MTCEICFYLGGTTWYEKSQKRLCDDCADCLGLNEYEEDYDD